MKGKLTITQDFVTDLNDIVHRLKKNRVLVGVPAEEAPRKTDTITNAALLAIHEYGSPANNIPPRPVLSIGLKLAKDRITSEFARGAKQALEKGSSAITEMYERVGIVASQSVKKVINDQIDIDPPSPVTLKRRLQQGFKGTKALLVTAQLRNSITYVVRGDGSN